MATGCGPWFGGKTAALEQRNAQLAAQVTDLEGQIAALKANRPPGGRGDGGAQQQDLAAAIAERDAAREAAAASELRASSAERELAGATAKLEQMAAEHKAELERIQVS